MTTDFDVNSTIDELYLQFNASAVGDQCHVGTVCQKGLDPYSPDKYDIGWIFFFIFWGVFGAAVLFVLLRYLWLSRQKFEEAKNLDFSRDAAPAKVADGSSTPTAAANAATPTDASGAASSSSNAPDAHDGDDDKKSDDSNAAPAAAAAAAGNTSTAPDADDIPIEQMQVSQIIDDYEGDEQATCEKKARKSIAAHGVAFQMNARMIIQCFRAAAAEVQKADADEAAGRTRDIEALLEAKRKESGKKELSEDQRALVTQDFVTVKILARMAQIIVAEAKVEPEVLETCFAARFAQFHPEDAPRKDSDGNDLPNYDTMEVLAFMQRTRENLEYYFPSIFADVPLPKAARSINPATLGLDTVISDETATIFCYIVALREYDSPDRIGRACQLGLAPSEFTDLEAAVDSIRTERGDFTLTHVTLSKEEFENCMETATGEKPDPVNVVYRLFPFSTDRLPAQKLVGAAAQAADSHERSFVYYFCHALVTRARYATMLAAYTPYLILFVAFLLFGINYDESFLVHRAFVVPTMLNKQPTLASTFPGGCTPNCAFFESYFMAYDEIAFLADAQDWMTTTMVDAFWPEADQPASSFRFNGNVPVGALKIRQLRSDPRKDPNRIAAYFNSNPNKTLSEQLLSGWFAQNASQYPDMGLVHTVFEGDTHSRKDMLPRNDIYNDPALDPRIKEAFRYRTGDELNATDFYNGKQTIYGPDGYALMIPFSASGTKARALISTILNKEWIDMNTRFLVVEAYLYNAQLHQLFRLRMAMETTIGGMWVPTYDSTLASLFNPGSHTTGFYFFMVVFFVYLFFYIIPMGFVVFFFSIPRKSMKSRREKGFKAYVRSLAKDSYRDNWACLVLANSVVQFVAWVYRLIVIFEHSTGSQGLDLVQAEYLPDNYDRVMATARGDIYTTALAIAFAFFIPLFYLTHQNDNLAVVARTISRASDSLMSLVIISVMMLVSFAVCAFIAYGDHLPDYRNPAYALGQVLLASIGEFDYQEWRDVHLTFTAVFFFLTSMLLELLLLNMVVSVLMDAFDEEMDHLFDADGAKLLIQNDPDVQLAFPSKRELFKSSPFVNNFWITWQKGLVYFKGMVHWLEHSCCCTERESDKNFLVHPLYSTRHASDAVDRQNQRLYWKGLNRAVEYIQFGSLDESFSGQFHFATLLLPMVDGNYDDLATVLLKDKRKDDDGGDDGGDDGSDKNDDKKEEEEKEKTHFGIPRLTLKSLIEDEFGSVRSTLLLFQAMPNFHLGIPSSVMLINALEARHRWRESVGKFTVRVGEAGAMNPRDACLQLEELLDDIDEAQFNKAVRYNADLGDDKPIKQALVRRSCTDVLIPVVTGKERDRLLSRILPIMDADPRVDGISAAEFTKHWNELGIGIPRRGDPAIADNATEEETEGVLFPSPEEYCAKEEDFYGICEMFEADPAVGPEPYIGHSSVVSFLSECVQAQAERRKFWLAIRWTSHQVAQFMNAVRKDYPGFNFERIIVEEQEPGEQNVLLEYRDKIAKRKEDTHQGGKKNKNAKKDRALVAPAAASGGDDDDGDKKKPATPTSSTSAAVDPLAAATAAVAAADGSAPPAAASAGADPDGPAITGATSVLTNPAVAQSFRDRLPPPFLTGWRAAAGDEEDIPALVARTVVGTSYEEFFAAAVKTRRQAMTFFEMVGSWMSRDSSLFFNTVAYLIFVVMFTIFALMNRGLGELVWMSESHQEYYAAQQFTYQSLDGGIKSSTTTNVVDSQFDNLHDLQNWIQWVDQVLVTGAWNGPNVPESRYVDGTNQNVPVGSIVMRQLRYDKRDCGAEMLPLEPVPKPNRSDPLRAGRAELFDRNCADFETLTQKPFGRPDLMVGLDSDVKEAFQHRTCEQLGTAGSFTTDFNTIGCDGYAWIVRLDQSKASVLAKFNSLINAEWIDNQTSVIVVHATFFNQNLNNFARWRYFLELTPGGQVYPFTDLVNVRPWISADAGNTYKGFLGLFFFFVLLQGAATLSTVVSDYTRERETGSKPLVAAFRAMTDDLWWLINLTNVIILIVLWSWRFDMMFSETDGITIWKDVVPARIEILAERTVVFNLIEAFCAILTYFRIAFYLRSFPSLNLLARTLFIAASDIWSLVLIFVIVFLGFGLSAFFVIGAVNQEFATIDLSLGTLFRVLLGADISFSSMVELHPVWAGVFYAAFIIACEFVLFNLIIAVLNASLEKARNETVDQSSLEMAIEQDSRAGNKLRYASFEACGPLGFIVGTIYTEAAFNIQRLRNFLCKPCVGPETWSRYNMETKRHPETFWNTFALCTRAPNPARCYQRWRDMMREQLGEEDVPQQRAHDQRVVSHHHRARGGLEPGDLAMSPTSSTFQAQTARDQAVLVPENFTTMMADFDVLDPDSTEKDHLRVRRVDEALRDKLGELTDRALNLALFAARVTKMPASLLLGQMMQRRHEYLRERDDQDGRNIQRVLELATSVLKKLRGFDDEAYAQVECTSPVATLMGPNTPLSASFGARTGANALSATSAGNSVSFVSGSGLQPLRGVAQTVQFTADTFWQGRLKPMPVRDFTKDPVACPAATQRKLDRDAEKEQHKKDGGGDGAAGDPSNASFGAPLPQVDNTGLPRKDSDGGIDASAPPMASTETGLPRPAAADSNNQSGGGTPSAAAAE